ncbi:hypothetical protein AOCH_004280 [Aspergillus ochraceoroseus]|uniref:L-ornithine N(5)-monooxygenase n=1 Tax=Aspergillus ochraceoroseus TaxID=138278 RepID=A0A0F8W305_9EURO|nr:hypothetical protein AOCH_004280 [Aspergillus ochraceoroseus]
MTSFSSPPPSYPPLLDTLIIGAGPCGLAVAARLREHTPSALFTDEEHQRYHWINKHRGKMNIVRARGGKLRGVSYRRRRGSGSSVSDSGWSSLFSSSSSSSSSSVSGEREGAVESAKEEEEEEEENPSLLVLDSSGTKWLNRWHRAFQTLEIQQLRSPMFFHVDPGDRDGMLAYTREMGREGDLWEISGTIGNTNIDERDRKDYFSPSTGLFADYCESIASRYGLDTPGLIRDSEVVDIRYDFHVELSPLDKIFTVVTRTGEAFYSRTVVVAVGPGGKKIYPFRLEGDEAQGACHSAEIRTFPSPNVKRKMQQRRETNVVVVGGGLSSAQIADMAIRKGVSRVWFLLRSDFKVKHFDIDLNWMGKFKNYEKAAFWSADTDEERMEMIKTARNGGSITPRYQRILREHAAHRRVSIHPRTVICSKEYCSVTQTWRLTTDPPIPDLPDIDYIYFATGMHMDVRELQFLENMHRDYPVETIQGLPCITDDLMWKPDVPLFLAGRLAALRLGPGAPNLEGARLGAERIAWSMEEVLGKHKAEDAIGIDQSRECFCGLGNRYAQLAECSLQHI